MDLSNVQITPHCIITMVHWGKDIITNVCNGTVTEVPWGIINYINYSLGGFVVLVIVAMIVALIILCFKDN